MSDTVSACFENVEFEVTAASKKSRITKKKYFLCYTFLKNKIQYAN